MACAVGAVLNGMSTPEAAAVPVAFAVGTLPLAAIWKFMQEKAGLKTDAGKFWEPDLYLVQGLTQDARDRLVQEQIDSVERPHASCLGTGFLISPRLFITNCHVIGSVSAAHGARLTFDREMSVRLARRR